MRVDIKEWHQEGDRVLRHGHLLQEDRRAQRPLSRPLRHVRRRQGREQVAGRPGNGDERRGQAAVFPVRHRQCRPRPAVANADGRPHLAGHRPACRLRRRRHRRALRRHGRLHRRQDRRGHDAHRRRALFAAVHLLRHHAGGVLRPQFRADVPRRRRRAVARHGAHRARPGAVDPPAGICAGGRGDGRLASAASCCRHVIPNLLGPGGHLHDAAGAAGDHAGKLPVLPRASACRNR